MRISVAWIFAVGITALVFIYAAKRVVEKWPIPFLTPVVSGA